MRRVTTTIVILAVLASLAVGLLIGRLAGGSNSKEPSRSATAATITTSSLPITGGTPSPIAPVASPAATSPSPAASPAAATPEPGTPALLEPTATPSPSPTPPLATSTPTPPPMGAMPTSATLPSPPLPAAFKGAADHTASVVPDLISLVRPISTEWGDGTGGPCSLRPSPSIADACR